MGLSFVLHYSVRSEAEKVKNFFENMERFAELHPLIQSATKNGEKNYTIRERMPFAFFRFNYESEITTHNGNEVQYIAYPFFLILTIKFKFIYSKEEHCTFITESVHIKGPPLVSHILKSAVIDSHKKIIQRIKKLIEVPATGMIN